MGRLTEALAAIGSTFAPVPTPSRELTAASPTTIKSWTGRTSQLTTLPADLLAAFGINISTDSVTRAQAMSIPAVRQGRNIIAGTLGAVPLVATRTIAGRPPERVPRSFLQRPDPSCTLASTLTWTIDDLMFRGVGWWWVTDFDSTNYPASGFRVDPARLAVDLVNRQVAIDGVPVKDADLRRLIRFDGPDEGVLVHGARTLKTCLLLEAAVRRYATMDIPLGFIKDDEGSLTEGEIQDLLDEWEAKRAARTTAYLPKGMSYDVPGFNAEQVQLAEARGYQSQEVGRLLNLPASYINAPTNDSLTYSTTESNRRDLVDIAFAPYIAAIQQRLSMPDVTPLGTEVAFDLSKFLRGDTKSVIETGALAVSSGLMTKDEVRTQWLNLPPLPATPQEASNG